MVRGTCLLGKAIDDTSLIFVVLPDVIGDLLDYFLSFGRFVTDSVVEIGPI
jgi:hypothetical protein